MATINGAQGILGGNLSLILPILVGLVAFVSAVFLIYKTQIADRTFLTPI